MKKRLCLLMLLAPLALTGANGGGCGAEPSASGQVFSNATFDVPEPTDERGITCEWLDGDNCWKQMLQVVVECGPPDGAIGRLSPDGRRCSFDGGHIIDFAGVVSVKPDLDASFSTQLIAYQMRAPDGSVCLETAFGWGQQRFRTDLGEIYQQLSGITDSITCPDGVRYAQSHPDTCTDYNSRYFAGETPRHGFVRCNEEECWINYWGGWDDKARRIAQCRP